MSTTQNKALVERMFNEVMNNRNFSAISEIVAPNFVNHSMPMPTHGPEGMKAVVEMFASAFPDMHIKLSHVIGDGDLVATAGTWSGTNEGSFMGMPATGNKVTNIPYIDIWKFKDGKATENWVQMDNVAIMQQLGHMPQPA
jgi:steroid delta-isomerase-like uncharacterized protein